MRGPNNWIKECGRFQKYRFGEAAANKARKKLRRNNEASIETHNKYLWIRVGKN